ncbi:uncharacterized protein BKA78DRAFT_130221 [Phyllosticta capitalensis]|uniref:uncharacterized protein n=1 Tax=Phyllosticta capitalensis TaxID=121624 RepID=UPI0031321709
MAAGMGVRAASALYAFLFLGTVTGIHERRQVGGYEIKQFSPASASASHPSSVKMLQSGIDVDVWYLLSLLLRRRERGSSTWYVGFCLFISPQEQEWSDMIACGGCLDFRRNVYV